MLFLLPQSCSGTQRRKCKSLCPIKLNREKILLNTQSSNLPFNTLCLFRPPIRSFTYRVLHKLWTVRADRPHTVFWPCEPCPVPRPPRTFIRKPLIPRCGEAFGGGSPRWSRHSQRLQHERRHPPWLPYRAALLGQHRAASAAPSAC